jgi:hypothetical protein
MKLEIIGAGWSRTGTFSLRQALHTLSFGPCYHMHEVFERPEHHALWRAAAAGTLRDWQTILGGYRSVADSPACLFWRELVAAYPSAKVILTLRNPADWYESMRSTVYGAMLEPERVSGDAASRSALELARELVLDGFFAGQFLDEATAIARFNAHNEAVTSEVPRERLLVYEVSAGWDPLCAFLRVPVPSEPFPKTNSRAQFRQRSGLRE